MAYAEEDRGLRRRLPGVRSMEGVVLFSRGGDLPGLQAIVIRAVTRRGETRLDRAGATADAWALGGTTRAWPRSAGP